MVRIHVKMQNVLARTHTCHACHWSNGEWVGVSCVCVASLCVAGGVLLFVWERERQGHNGKK